MESPAQNVNHGADESTESATNGVAAPVQKRNRAKVRREERDRQKQIRKITPEARALKKNIRSSPRKMRLLIDLIRGKNAYEALGILRFSPQSAARDAELTLRSAIANLQVKDVNGNLDPETFYVKEAYVNGGTMMKRVLPAPMGRAYRVRKRSNHLTIVVGTR